MISFIRNNHFVQLYLNVIIRVHLEEKLFKENAEFPNFYKSSLMERNNSLMPNLFNINLSFRHRHSEKEPLLFLMRLLMLERVSGRRPSLTRAHDSVASFNLKRNFVMGASAQLRGLNSYHFLAHFILNCLSKSSKLENFFSEFEQIGTIGFSVKDIYIFPELDQEFQKWIDFVPPFSAAFQIDLSFSLKSYLSSLMLLSHLGFVSL